MAIPTEVIMRMATLGLDEAQAQAVADMLTAVEIATKAAADAMIEHGRSKVRERVQRWRDNHQSNVTERYVASRNGSREGVRVEDKTLTSEIEPQEESKKEARAARDVSEFRAALSPDLDAERLDALVKHRRSKRGQLTALSAKLFRRDAAECGMALSEAVDTCISRNWITVKPEYFGSRQRAGPPAKKSNPTLDAARNLMDQFNAAPPVEIEGHHPAPRLVAIGGR